MHRPEASSADAAPRRTSALDRLRRLTERQSPRKVKVSSALRFYHEVLGLDHLQYGLWDSEPLTLEGLKSAQERYADTLHSWIPEGVRTILDIGAGTGAGSRKLKGRGYEVEGLSPDPHQQKLYTRRVERPFHLARLQEFEPAKLYDLALMSESAQYVWLDVFFDNVRKVAAGGYLLLADYFVTVPDAGELGKSGHPLEVFLERAEAEGFELLRREDITERVAPTLDLGRLYLDEYIDPTLEIVLDAVEHKVPRLFRLARPLLKKELKKLEQLHRTVDSAEFQHLKRYLILLFRVPPATEPGTAAL